MNSQKPVAQVPPTDAEPHTVPPQSTGAAPVSRRDFLAATAATGIALGAGTSVSALAQGSDGSTPATAGAPQGAVSSALPTGESFDSFFLRHAPWFSCMHLVPAWLHSIVRARHLLDVVGTRI